MRWVLITALGNLVEPLVNRNLTTVSGPVARMAASTAAVAAVPSSSEKGVMLRPLALLPSTLASTTSTSGGSTASMDGPYCGQLGANTRPGVRVCITWRSLS